jgi:hypothetical protein
MFLKITLAYKLIFFNLQTRLEIFCFYGPVESSYTPLLQVLLEEKYFLHPFGEGSNRYLP